ncbi:MAG: UDP-N-acetylmuramate--L-alanine ligase [Bacteriovoracaceae bacterium]
MFEEYCWTQGKIEKSADSIKRIFFYRICGTGMGAAATLLKQKGYDVEGADVNFYPPMSDYLEQSEIKVQKLSDVTDEYLKEFDIVVVGNVVAGKSEDGDRIKNMQVPYCSFPAILGALVLKDYHVVGVAGTHGKTTTTYFLTQLFEALGEEPGYFIGGIMEGRPPARLGKSKYFFIESDEYDCGFFEKFSKFHLYKINSLILTSLEFDHADIYNDVEEIKDEFRKLLPTLNEIMIGNVDYPHSLDLIREKIVDRIKALIPYGQASHNGPQIIEASEKGTKFFVRYGQNEDLYETNLIGRHNIANISAAVIFALTQGYSKSEVKACLSNIVHVKRRQELRGNYNGMPIIDDFAHHPTAIQLTLEGIEQQYPDKKIIVLYEPNSATARSNIFLQDYLHAFRKVARFAVTKINRPTSAKNNKTLSLEELNEGLIDKGVDTIIVKSLDEVQTFIETLDHEDSILLVMSNGTCLGLWQSDFIKNLEKA